MAAATKSRQAASLNSFEEAKYAPKFYNLKTDEKIFSGTLVGILPATGEVQTAKDLATLRVLGLYVGPDLDESKATVQNPVQLNGIDISRNIHLLENDTGTPVVDGDINKTLFVVNDQTVSTATGANSIVAGKMRGLASQLSGVDGVYCDISAI